MSEPTFLGTGWSFPPCFSDKNGQVLMSEGEQEIEQSLKILLGTTQGERFMVPEYGLNLRAQVFESLNTTARNLLTDKIERTLLVYEPRIKLLSVQLDERELNAGKLLVLIEYEIRSTNSRFNLVYPYYQYDGTEVTPGL